MRVYPSLPPILPEFDRVNLSQTRQTFQFHKKSSLPPSWHDFGT